MKTNPRSRLWSALAAAILSLAALALRADAQDAFSGELDIALGDGVTSSFVHEGEAHEFSFFGTAGTRIDAVVRRGPGASVSPSLRLLRPGGYQVPTGRALRIRGDQARLRRFVLPYSGWFVLEVAAIDGIGAYSLSTSARPSRRLRGYVEAAEGSQEFRFFAAAGTRVSAVLRPLTRGSGARPRITGITAPNGDPIPVISLVRGTTSRISDLPLPASGRYALLWENTGRRGAVGLRFTLRTSDVTTQDRVLAAASGIPASRIDTGDARIDAAVGYIGSGACGRCHDDIFRSWTRTAHHLAVRPWNQPGLAGVAFVNDVNRNGTDDFRDGLDLATQPAFAAFGPNAPRLSYVGGAERPYRMTIGAVTYEVARTMGGNGLWKQRYLLKIGNHLIPSPVQFNDQERAYAAYETTAWYDAGNLPLYAAASQVPKSKSFEARCSGCHNTGQTLEVDPATGDYLTGCVDFNVGCEQCHGPGKAHADTGDPAKVKNPRALLDGTREGIVAANGVCGRCHTRGDAIDAFPGTTVKAGFGFSAAHGVQEYGDDQAQFFVPTTNPADFWGFKTNPFPALPGNTWVASKGHRQQSLDIAVGGHAPSDDPRQPSCFDCHDPHARETPHQIRTRVVRSDLGVGRAASTGVRITTSASDGSLCLSCHAGAEPFASLTLGDVAGIASGATRANVAAAVVHHMADRAMRVDVSLYDPAGTGVGNCVTCHMPLVERTAVWSADKAGFRKGDLHSHVFHTVTPRASQLHKDAGIGVSNSCSTCHPTVAGDPVATILTEWASDGADADNTFHADTPRSIHAGVANPGRDGGTPCVRCHTTEGFIEVQVKGRTLAQSAIDRIVKDSLAREKGIACDACHGTRADGALDQTTRQPLRMAKAELCGSCHNNQTVVFEDFRDRGEMVRHPTREMLLGTAGAESPGYETWLDSPHGAFQDGCVTCHYDPSRAGASHTFAPQTSACGQCHAGLVTFNRPSPSDYDGDGNVAEGVQGEVQGLLDVLKAALLLDPQVTFASGSFDYAGATDHRMTGASEAQKRAAFNWYSVVFDASGGVHNTARSVQLLQRSYRELRGVDVPGAVLK